jgi:hypothetical protein
MAVIAPGDPFLSLPLPFGRCCCPSCPCRCPSVVAVALPVLAVALRSLLLPLSFCLSFLKGTCCSPTTTPTAPSPLHLGKLHQRTTPSTKAQTNFSTQYPSNPQPNQRQLWKPCIPRYPIHPSKPTSPLALKSTAPFSKNHPSRNPNIPKTLHSISTFPPTTVTTTGINNPF